MEKNNQKAHKKQTYLDKVCSFQKYALLSVYNKKHISSFAKFLFQNGYKIIASRGTGAVLAKHNIPFISTEKETHNPDALKDCINTISYRLSAGILYNRENTNNIRDAIKLNIKSIDVVVCNFVPFQKYIKDPNKDFNIHNVDVGGPLMVRAAAVNFKSVLALTEPGDYSKASKAISENKNNEVFRKQFSVKALKYISAYNKTLINFLNNNIKY